jgi:hypothetical protein
MGEKDLRGELVRVRLSEVDLARVSAIQGYYGRAGLPTSLQRVVADAISSYYFSLVEKGADIESP